MVVFGVWFLLVVWFVLFGCWLVLVCVCFASGLVASCVLCCFWFSFGLSGLGVSCGLVLYGFDGVAFGVWWWLLITGLYCFIAFGVLVWLNGFYGVLVFFWLLVLLVSGRLLFLFGVGSWLGWCLGFLRCDGFLIIKK